MNRGIGNIKVTKQPDGTYKAEAANVPSVVAATERAAILRMGEVIKETLETDAAKAPYRIIN